MDFELAPLPYEKSALEPYVSGLTVDVHYERHHRGYLERLKELIAHTRDAERSLADLVEHAEGEVLHNAAQVWNHDFYWRSLTPLTPADPPAPLRGAIDASFRNVGALRWLQLGSADNPLPQGLTSLLAIVVWQYAYYIDRRSRCGDDVAGAVDHLL